MKPILEELEKAQQGTYAIPCIDVFDSSSAQGALAALEEKRAPGILAIYSSMMEKPNIRAFATYLLALADAATVPVSVILDHGTSFEQCAQALSMGLPDVMYDGSQLPLEENIANTRLVVRAAHAAGAMAEAEVGHVGQGCDYENFGGCGEGFTEPEVAVRFVKETGVDYLAVAIGSAHGLYAGEPQLDLELLAAIRQRVDVPLVLHGGSGLSDDQFRAAVAGGITKINLCTDLCVTATRRVTEMTGGIEGELSGGTFVKMTAQISDAFRDRCAHYLDVFGASGKA